MMQRTSFGCRASASQPARQFAAFCFFGCWVVGRGARVECKQFSAVEAGKRFGHKSLKLKISLLSAVDLLT
eukprot:scaffold2262_cov107-Skeletonema_dohrnii-CCMP3373.AAC.10